MTSQSGLSTPDPGCAATAARRRGRDPRPDARDDIDPSLDTVQQVDGPARRPAAQLPGHPPHGHQRQDVDDPDGRLTAARDGPRRWAGSPRRTCTRSASASPSAASRSRPSGSSRSTTRCCPVVELVDRRAGRGGRRPAQLLHDVGRAGVRRLRRRPGRRRRRRGRPRRAAGTRPTSPTARSPSSRRWPSTTPGCSGRRSRRSRRRSPGSSSRARSPSPRCRSATSPRSSLERAEEVGARIVFEGVRLRRHVARGRARRAAADAQGAGGRVPRGVPAPARRAPGRATRPRRWPRSRRSSGAASSGSTPTSCGRASPRSPRPGASRSCAARPPCSSTPRTTRPG